MTTMNSNDIDKRIYGLCVDDEEGVLPHLAECIQENGMTPLYAKNADEAESLIKRHHRDLGIVVSDLSMPGRDGLQLRKSMLDLYRDIPFVVVSGAVTQDIVVRAVEFRVSAFVSKPFEHKHLVGVVKEQSKPRIDAIEERRFLEPTFFQEAGELLEELEPLFLALEDRPDDEDSINSIFRLVHTIKGSSGILGRSDVTGYLHAFEDLLSKIKSRQMAATPDVVSILLQHHDKICTVITSLQSRVEPPLNLGDEANSIREILTQGARKPTSASGVVTKSSTGASAAQRKDGVFVTSKLLDEFMAMSGEITVIRNMVNKIVVTLERKLVGDEDIRLLGELLEEMHKINSGMQNQITELRKIPMTTVLAKLPRTIRDLCKSLGKDVQLQVRGESLKVDNTIAQALSGSLIHMVRNCVDHGIESADVRNAKKKSPVGQVLITCAEEGEVIKVTVEDDGGGIDPAKIRAKMIEKLKIPKAQVDEMPEKKIFAQIFESGFSTAAVVTDVSGRGVGMDMVKTSIEALKGKIDIDSKLGEGTRFSIFIPVPKSVVIIHSLVVECGGRTFAIPQDNVSRLIQVDSGKSNSLIRTLQGAEVLSIDGGLVPMVKLSNLLGFRARSADDAVVTDQAEPSEFHVVLMRAERGSFGLVVDRVLDAEDVVVKGLAKYVDSNGLFKGATFMGDGSIGLILDADGLAKRANIEDVRIQVASNQTKSTQVSSVERDFLLFRTSVPGRFSIDLSEVFRLEKFATKDFQMTAGNQVVVYRESIMPIHDLASILGNTPTESITLPEEVSVIVMQISSGFVGFIIDQIDDVVRTEVALTDGIKLSNGCTGCFIYRDATITMVSGKRILNLLGYLRVQNPDAEASKDKAPDLRLVVGSSQQPPKEPMLKELADSVGTTKVDEAEGWGLF
jgi:two-component system chemotaxis sensor kinase CheA